MLEICGMKSLTVLVTSALFVGLCFLVIRRLVRTINGRDRFPTQHENETARIRPVRQRWLPWVLVGLVVIGLGVAFAGFTHASENNTYSLGATSEAGNVGPWSLWIQDSCGGLSDPTATTNCEQQMASNSASQSLRDAAAYKAAANRDLYWAWLGVLIALPGLIGLIVWWRKTREPRIISRCRYCDARLRLGVIKCAKCGSATVGPDALVLLEGLNAGTPLPNFVVDHPELAQRLRDAERDPEKVYAVVEGTGVQVVVVEGFLVEVPRDPTDKVDALALRKVHNAWFGDGQHGRCLYVESDDFQWWFPDINPDMGKALASWLRTSRLQSAR